MDVEKKNEEKKVNGQGEQLQMSRLSKYIISFVVYYCTFALGITFTILSPTVTHFGRKFDTDVDNVSKVFTVVTASYLSGALASGILSKFLNRYLMVITFLSLMAATLYVLPHINTIMPFYIINGIMGFSSGVYDPTQIAWIIEVWGHDAGPWILGQHFAYAVGTVIPPVLLSPFLTDYPEENGTAIFPIIPITTTTGKPLEVDDLTIPFSIGGALVSVAVLIQFGLYFKLGRNPKTVPVDSNDPHSLDAETTHISGEGSSRKRTLLLIFLSLCVCGFYQGLELTTMSFIPTFSEFAKVDLDKSDAATILSALTIAFACGRGVGIVVVMKVPPQYILLGNFTLMIVANTILLTLAQNSETMLWVTAIVYGIGMSTTYPTYYAFIEKFLLVTPQVAATMVFMGGLVAAVYPLIVGKSVETNPSILPIIDFVSIAICVTAFCVTYYITMIRQSKKVK